MSEPVAFVAERSQLGVLRFTGATRLDLIQRMSTQDVKGLTPGAGTATVLTTDIGRMVDRLLIYADVDVVIAVTGEDNAETVARYLRRYVFFMDDFQVENLTPTLAVWGVYGRAAVDCLATAGLTATGLPLHHWVRYPQADGTSLSVHRTDPVAGDGYFVLGPRAQAEAIRARLVRAGAELVSAETFDYQRLVSGLPRFGREITSDYIPLEANLWADVSFHKGCYIGQEIIARLDSRGKLAKKLAHVYAEAPLSAGAEIVLNGKAVGTLTSAAEGPAGTFGLGYIKAAALADAPSDLRVGATPITLLAH